uniref:PAZ domain-containing protein n=1 Tax=Caenorhabditis tropicalis TaxID=1561998 RepID=A0A1I7U6W8_9PELO
MVRLCMDTHLCGGKVKIKLSDGLTSVSGGLNTTDKRLALRVIFRKIVSRHPEIFGTDLLKYTFDCATTIYAVDGAFKGGNDKLEETLRKEDFKDEEWSQISRIIRRQATYFKVAISANGYVYTRGSDFEAVKNRQELTRLIEIASSEVLNTPDFLQYGSQTFPLKTRVTNKPDETSEIRMGFDKGVRLLDKGDIAMSIDNKQSPFYSATSVLKFVTSKYGEHVGIPGAAPQRRGDQRGREDPRGQRNRSRSRSPRREHQETPLDYDIGQVNHVMNAFTSKRDPAVFRAIEEAIKGIFAEPIHLPKTHNHNIVITGFAKTNAKNTYFKLNEGQENEATINVEDYFFQHRERRLQFPLLPLIKTGKGNRKTYFPMELLKIVPGQRIKAQKMSTVVVREYGSNLWYQVE